MQEVSSTDLASRPTQPDDTAKFASPSVDLKRMHLMNDIATHPKHAQHPKRAFGFVLCGALLLLVWSGCATASTSGPQHKNRDRGFIQMNVEPKAARVYIDETYQGQVQGWMHQTVPVRPGMRRVELRARGYITQRFDLEIARGEVLTLTLRMERQLEELKLTPKSRARRTRP